MAYMKIKVHFVIKGGELISFILDSRTLRHNKQKKRKHPLSLNMEPWPETTLGSRSQLIGLSEQASDGAARGPSLPPSPGSFTSARPGVLHCRHSETLNSTQQGQDGPEDY